MEFEVIFSPKALKQIKSLDRQIQERIKVAIERNLQVFPPKGDIVKLEAKENCLRLRVGVWRITFRYRFQEKEVHIAEIRHRSKAYK